MIGRMVLFGASGDLTSRLLMPAVGRRAIPERRVGVNMCGSQYLAREPLTPQQATPNRHGSVPASPEG